MKNESTTDTVAKLNHELRELQQKLAQAEEKIRIQEQSKTSAAHSSLRSRATFDGGRSEQPTAIVSASGVMLSCTDRFAAIFHRPAAQLKGMQLIDLIEPGYRTAFEQLLTGEPGEAELLVDLGSATTFPVVLSASPAEESGETTGETNGAAAKTPSGPSVLLTDITEQRHPELLLAEEVMTRSIFEHLADAVLVCNGQGRIIRASRAAHALCGFNPLLKHFQEALPLSWLRGPLDRPAVTVDTALRGVTIRGWEVSFERSDGNTFALLLSAGPLHSEPGTILGAVITLTDITALRTAELELKRKADDLQETDRRKNEFLAMLAHELRNPLTPIRSSLEIMNIKGIDDPDIRRCRDVISRQTQYFTCLIDDLLEVSRINTGKIQLRSQSVDLTQSIHAAAETARSVVEAKRHTLKVECPDEPIWISADPTRLAQILGNLISNAAKYTDPGGTLSLSVHREKLEAVIRIKDTGQGIPPEMLSKVFELFTQVDRSLDRSQGGLGIGLALVRKLVMMHGGLVEAASEGLGQGSEFIVRLPTAGAPPLPHPQPDDQTQSKSPPRRVLVVDDDADSSQSLATLLRMLGHEVRTASDGQAALAAADQFHPDVVLCDIGLPILDGYEVARQLRSRVTDRNPPRLIALTGYGREEDVRRSRDAGFHLHLVKPFDRDMLDAVLNH